MYRTLLLCFTSLLSVEMFGQTASQAFVDATVQTHLTTLENAVNCPAHIMVLPETFNKLTGNFLTKLAPGVSGDLRNTTGANVKFSDDKTSAELQATFRLSNLFLFNAGFNGSVTDNIVQIYSGKSGLASDWGVKAGLSYKVSSGMIYASPAVCEDFHLKRTDYLSNLYNELSPNLNLNVAAYRALVAAQEVTVAGNKAAGNFLSDSATKRAARMTLNSMKKNLTIREDIFGDYTTASDVSASLYEYLEDSVVAWEMRNAHWTGYNIGLISVNGFYNHKGFTQFNSLQPVYKNRFYDTAYGNWGLAFNYSHYHIGQLTQQTFSIELGVGNHANLELPENKKYSKTFTLDSGITVANPAVNNYSTISKKAFDSTSISFKSFTSINVNAQYTILFGESKAFGFNVGAFYSNSAYYSVSNRLDFAFGPVLSLPNTDKDGSKLNFGLMGGIKNVFDQGTSTKDKLSVSFNVSIPFKVIAF